MNVNFYEKIQNYIIKNNFYSHILNFPLKKELKIDKTTSGFKVEGFFYSKTWDNLIKKCEYEIDIDNDMSLIELKYKN